MFPSLSDIFKRDNTHYIGGLPQNLGKCSIADCNIPASVRYGDINYCVKHWEQWIKIRKLKNLHKRK